MRGEKNTERHQKMVAMRAACLTNSEIAAALNVSRQHVHQELGPGGMAILRNRREIEVKLLVGTSIGQRTILRTWLEHDSNRPGGRDRIMVELLCVCKRKSKSTLHAARKTESCGCVFDEKRRVSHVGQRFGRLVVLEEWMAKTESAIRSYKRCRCQCDCGGTCVTHWISLIQGHCRSCGCLATENANRSRRAMMGLPLGPRVQP